MAKTTAKPATRRTREKPVIEALNRLLADSYTLYLKTHNFHWNVSGPMFTTLHTLFEQEYTELALAVDEIAERIRALGTYAIGGLGNLAKVSGMTEFASPLPQDDYVRLLLAANEKLVADAARARDLAGEAQDAESQDLMIGRITIHQKTIWMLKSFLKS